MITSKLVDQGFRKKYSWSFKMYMDSKIQAIKSSPKNCHPKSYFTLNGILLFIFDQYFIITSVDCVNT